MSVQSMPRLDDVQAHYCGYFGREDISLEAAQIAKIGPALSKLDLQPGMTLLDFGCGRDAAMKRAIKMIPRRLHRRRSIHFGNELSY